MGKLGLANDRATETWPAEAEEGRAWVGKSETFERRDIPMPGSKWRTGTAWRVLILFSFFLPVSLLSHILLPGPFDIIFSFTLI